MSDPVSVIGVVLSALRLLQGMSKDSPPKEKIGALKDAMQRIDQLYQLLHEAKSIHDKFQELETIAVEPFEKSVERDRTDLARIREHTETFLGASMLIAPDFTLSTTATFQKFASSSSDEVPSIIAKPVQDIFRFYEKLAKELMNFERSMEQLKALHERSNYGRDFADNVPKVKDSARWALVHADKLIVAIIPVISFTHHTTKGFVQAMP